MNYKKGSWFKRVLKRMAGSDALSNSGCKNADNMQIRGKGKSEWCEFITLQQASV